MPHEAGHALSMSDSYRDAVRYHRLLLALTRATGEIREIGEENYPSIEHVLERLLPDLAVALNAQKAFVAARRQDKAKDSWLELIAVYPGQEGVGRRLAWSEVLRQLVKLGKPKVIDPLGEPDPPLIEGLELFAATAAILVRMQVLDQVYVVGVCNQVDLDLGPFLAVDGRALDSIIELLAIGAQVGERRRRELESIQRTSAAISAELDLAELLPMIVKGAAEVFEAPAASLGLWDETEENLTIKAKWGLSDDYARRQRIPKEKVEAILESSGEFQSLLAVDLLDQPIDSIDLVNRERLQAVLGVPLRVRERLMGLLSIYSRDQSRRSTFYEQGLAQIFANQAAVAIQNARQYESLKRWRERLLALHESAKAVSASLERESTLQSILEEAARLTQAHFATIQEKREDCLYFAAVYPPEQNAVLKEKVGEAMPLDGPGITVKVANTGEPYLANDVREEPIFVDGPNQVTYSELAVPLLEMGRVRGVLNVEHSRPGAFNQNDVEVLTSLASLAVLALQNAERYERLNRTKEQLRVLHKAGRIVLARAGLEIAKAGLEVETAMRAILDQAMTVTGAFFGTLQLVDGDDLKLVAALPAERLEDLKQKVGRIPITGSGITARVVRENQAELVSDVSRDADFVDLTGETRSQLAVVLRRNGRLTSQPLGVLNVEHRQAGGFQEEDRLLLISLSDLAVVSLDYTQQAEQLSRTNAIALMGAWGADIVHDVNREVGAIRRVVFSLLQRSDLSPELRERLLTIDSYAGSLALPELPERAPEPGYIPTIRAAPPLDQVIRSEIEKLQQAYPAINLSLHPDCPGVKVAIHEQWLRRLVRHLVKNAGNAVAAEKRNRRVVVQTRVRESMAEVLVEDSGKGVRPEIETLLFRRPIPSPGPQTVEREGRGLLLVRYVVEMHGGRVWLDWSQPGQGARFAFSVPLAPERET